MKLQSGEIKNAHSPHVRDNAYMKSGATVGFLSVLFLMVSEGHFLQNVKIKA